jgi:hypothetical protein
LGVNHEVLPKACIPHCRRHVFKYPSVEAVRFYRLLTYLIVGILILESQIRLELEGVMLIHYGYQDVIYIVKDAKRVRLHLEGVFILALSDSNGNLLVRFLCEELPQIY